MAILKKALLLVLLVTTAAAAITFFGKQEIAKDSDLALALELPHREDKWTFIEPGAGAFSLPGEFERLKAAIGDEKFAEVSARVGLRGVNIEALRQASLDIEQSRVGPQPDDPAASPNQWLVIGDDGSEVAKLNIRNLATAIPSDVHLLALRPAAFEPTGDPAGDPKPLRVVRVPRNPQSRISDAESVRDVGDSLYLIHSPHFFTAAYTLFHKTGADLSWPDMSALDQLSPITNVKLLRAPILARSTDFVVVTGSTNTLFVSERAVAEEQRKRSQLLLPLRSMASLLLAYKQFFGVDGVEVVPVGPSFPNLASLMLATGKDQVILVDGEELGVGADPKDSNAIKVVAQKLLASGYHITKVAATARQVRDGLSPLSGKLIPGLAPGRPRLLMPVDARQSLDSSAAIGGLQAAGIDVVPVKYRSSGSTTLAQFLAWLP